MLVTQMNIEDIFKLFEKCSDRYDESMPKPGWFKNVKNLPDQLKLYKDQYSPAFTLDLNHTRSWKHALLSLSQLAPGKRSSTNWMGDSELPVNRSKLTVIIPSALEMQIRLMRESGKAREEIITALDADQKDKFLAQYFYASFVTAWLEVENYRDVDF